MRRRDSFTFASHDCFSGHREKDEIPVRKRKEKKNKGGNLTAFWGKES